MKRDAAGSLRQTGNEILGRPFDLPLVYGSASRGHAAYPLTRGRRSANQSGSQHAGVHAAIDEKALPGDIAGLR
jgi:hypothetical protein